jgi:hypothetical protein
MEGVQLTPGNERESGQVRARGHKPGERDRKMSREV